MLYYVPFKTSKRVTPSFTPYSAGTGIAGNLYRVLQAADAGGVANNPGTSGVMVTAIVGAGDHMAFHWVADARLF